MKILITGGTGFIGRHLVAYWRQSSHAITIIARHIDTALFNTTVNCIEADITAKEAIQEAVFSIQPDVVVHTAALSKPNDCEQDKHLCFTTNVTATEHIAAACKAIGTKLIFLSTDFVFGDNGPYAEADVCDPLNYYGMSKKLAEEAIRSSGVPYTIIRTGLVVGPRLKGQANTFLHWVRDSLTAGRNLQLYTDQQRSPTFVTDLCKGIDTIIITGLPGTIHLSGSDVFSPYTLAQQVAVYFELNQQLLAPVTFNERPEPARRPQKAVLKIDKAKQLLNYHTTPFDEIMKVVFQQ